jgi:DHA1 family bicyclomycin/chloramphenicol resistance-like MFS transporter
MLIVGVVPILAPTVGGQLLALLDWRGIFAVLTVVVLAGTVAGALLLPETLPAARRRPAGLRQVWGATRSVLADRVFVGATLTAGFAFGALLVYISDAAFVFEKVHGLSAQAFGLLFGLNALFLIVATQVNARVVQRVEPDLLVRRALPVMLAGAALLFVPALLPGLGLVALLPPIWVMLASLGFVTANAVVIALEPHGEAAGTASAVLGAVQFGLGSLLGPLTGLLGHDSAVPLAALLVLCVGCALLLHRFVTGPALRAAGA